MSTEQAATMFLPAQRDPGERVDLVRDNLLHQRVLLTVLDYVPMVVMILNGRRQVVLANRALGDVVGQDGLQRAIGQRPGEVLGCSHAAECDGGCGTTEYCRVCGAAIAILASQNGLSDIKECRITRTGGDALDLKVWTSPIDIEGDRFTFFCVVDITDEKRRRQMQRVFFHDILNSVTAVLGAASVMKDAPQEDKEELSKVILSSSERLIQDINTFRDLAAAESGDLAVKLETVSASELVDEIVSLYRSSTICQGKKLLVAAASADVVFLSDRGLVSRVLSNMLKNALEASTDGDTVQISAARRGSRVVLSVHNPGFMRDEVRLQVFQRSFSTKAPDRGLGTYSMKLLTEKYLGGGVSFVSTPAGGTTFTAEYPVDGPQGPVAKSAGTPSKKRQTNRP
jgi:nitrogen fixation/metabolism regulation signal transduction histidine kinase